MSQQGQQAPEPVAPVGPSVRSVVTKHEPPVRRDVQAAVDKAKIAPPPSHEGYLVVVVVPAIMGVTFKPGHAEVVEKALSELVQLIPLPLGQGLVALTLYKPPVVLHVHLIEPGTPRGLSYELIYKPQPYHAGIY